MSSHEVSEFIVVAPSTLGKAVQWAEQRLLAHLEACFPFFTFRIEPFGPLSDDTEYTVVPIMNQRPGPGEQTDSEWTRLCSPLDPNIIPEIKMVLRSFDLAGATTH
jgi:hypothetical protein